MHEAETRALRRATALLLLLSLARWGWSARAPTDADAHVSVLPVLLEASREAAAEEGRRSAALGEGERIDPNRADEIDLDRLPGVGPSVARAIVAAREAGAVFRSAEDLLAVSGIGSATLERIRPALDLASAPPASARRREGVGVRPSVAGTKALVDVNGADLQGLQGLPGIGPAIAERILVARREQVFTSLDDLVRVRGIGPATVERLRAHAIAGHVP